MDRWYDVGIPGKRKMAGKACFRIVAQIGLAFVLGAQGCIPWQAASTAHPITLADFGQLIGSLSEPEGFFDSDNFISNEAGYLRVIPAFQRLGLGAGAYLGVGPDQNYSYIAELRPDLAFIIDIRRQNMLQHLYYKALFDLSNNRMEFLERVFGREIAPAPAEPESLPIKDLLKYIDDSERDMDIARSKVEQAIALLRSWKLGLTEEDLKSIRYIAEAFVNQSLDLKFSSQRRPPRPQYPTYRALMEGTDPAGVQVSYLAEESRFQVIKELHRRHGIIPVIGDLAGPRAVQEVAKELRHRGVEVRVFYTSNVEYYIFRNGQWDAYVQNLRSLPLAANAHIIRSYANNWRPHPAAIRGYYLSTIMQSVRDFLANEDAGRNLTYWDIVTRDYITK
jgi:hypothetical protein